MIYVLGLYGIMAVVFCVLYLVSLFYASASFQKKLSLRESNKLQQRADDEQETARKE
jgi:hypothetical protein